MNLSNFKHKNLTISELNIKRGEKWCFYGQINSGVEDFFHLFDNNPEISPLPKAGIISFKTLQNIYEEELRNDDSDFLDYPDPGTLAKDFLPQNKLNHPLITTLKMSHILETGYRRLSSGQTRKLLLLKEVLSGKKKLIVFLPYDGLDTASCRELDIALEEISDRILLITLVHNREDIPSWCSHLGIFKDNQLTNAGLKEDVKPLLPAPLQKQPEIDLPEKERKPEPLIKLNNGFGGYGDLLLFSGLNLTINSGEHTLITGPNGCGKSTLLHIICGDHPSCYSNDLYVFGTKRGTGESIWEVKKDMGIISPELHRNHRCPGTALDIIIGGLFDSIGLYRRPNSAEVAKAEKWLSWLELSDKAKKSFRSLSFGEQRLILIARGLIKIPKLLILDEPTQGLDENYRHRFLSLMEKIAKKHLSTILFVSHRQDEHRDFFRQQIKLETFATQK